MRLLWTKSKLPLGSIITWGLEEPVSHFAVEFFDSIIIHSNMTGVHPIMVKDFLKTSEIVYEKRYEPGEFLENRLMVQILKNYWGKKYDWKWFFGLVKHAVVFKLFRKPVPMEIKSRSRDRFLCTEVAQFLEPIVGRVDIKNGSPFLLAKELGVA